MSSGPLRLFILAGEPSGDRIAADLVRRLRARTALEITGVGGEELIAEGLQPLYPMGDLSVMGLRDVLLRLPLLLWRIGQTARFIRAQKPDIVVLVDAQEFSARLAKQLRAAGFAGPILLYVAPSVWARHPERAARLEPLFDEVLAVLPFEPEVMQRLGGPETHYVGHPALAELGERAGGEGRRVALLPGSRGGELRRHLPLFRSVVGDLAAQHPDLSFYLPTLPALATRMRAAVAEWPVPVEIVPQRERRRDLYAETLLALTSAGTATLELALADVPMVITYVMEGVQARYYEKLGRPRVGLPNIVLKADVTPDLILPSADPAPVLAAATALIGDEGLRQAQHEAFGRLRSLMEEGAPGFPRRDAAERVLERVERQARRA
jgi:lipid-A-disaccharide synthase